MPSLITPDYLFNADPTCRQIGDRFWIFATHDQSTVHFQGPEDHWHNMYDYHAYSTADLVHWVDHGSILSIHDVSWARDFSVWDGDAGILGPDGRYYAYVPFRDDHFKIGVLVADQPQGPYRDALGVPFITNDTLRLARHTTDPRYTCTSPTVVHADDGRLWLMWGQFNVFLAPLAPNMTSFAGPIIELDIPKRSGQATEYIEGPMLHRIAGKWHFSYMTYKDWDAPNPTFSPTDPAGPYLRDCTADSMFGPFRDPKNWVLPFAPDACNNQHGLGQFNNRWLLAYHIPFQNKQHRQVALTPLLFNPDGQSLAVIDPRTDQGCLPHLATSAFPIRPSTPTPALVLDAYAYKREAEEFHARHDAPEERGIKQDFHLKLRAGGWLLFRNVDFGSTPPSHFIAALSSENHRLQNAFLDVRLDSPTGPVIASAPASFTYWITYYQTISTAVTHPVTGIHDLYLTARGQGPDAYGRLFNVNWFTFSRQTPTPPTPPAGR